MEYTAGKYDIIVVGGGHAGCEAALAAARLGCNTAMFAMNLDSIANMPCNPTIGGTAKGHLVKEIDSLGGEMGKIADKTFIQSRILNASKGPAVYSLRAQIDRSRYQIEMKHVLECQKNLLIKQTEIVDILVENGAVTGVLTHTGSKYLCKAVILTTGTYLRGKIIIGETIYNGGPDGMFPADRLSVNLMEKGVSMRRLKTGTPARLSGQTVNFEKMEKIDGDGWVTPFSFENDEFFEKWNQGDILSDNGHLVSREGQKKCWLTYTNSKTHKIIRDNLHRAPMYSGTIEGVGPRYCPSIEDKIVRFADKERHQLFIEPMGIATEEVYLGGMSTSMPEDIQEDMVHSVEGLENALIMRNAYAIEYDAVDATQLKLSLEFKKIDGLFSAGQINGTSGYEEAAAQGLMAGINAARKIHQKEAVVLDRSQGYIGVLIDDIVVKGPKEPYRMMTSKAEYRLLLRQDNADRRLTPIGYDIGLISQSRYDHHVEKCRMIENEIRRLENTYTAPAIINDLLRKNKSAEIATGLSFAELLKRPEIDYDLLTEVDLKRPVLPEYMKKNIETEIKYEGYLKRQLLQVEQFKKMEKKGIPEDLDYETVYGLRIEARQQLSMIRPVSIGQAGRIAGVSPADISVLLIALEQMKKRS